jgi:hypothetical protein
MEKLKNVTYLLGAGASANCLLVINEMPRRLEYFSKQFVDANSLLLPVIHSEYRGTTEHLLLDIEWLQNEIKPHKTVDTLAKKYYLTGKIDSLLRLKKVLLTYFQFEQSYEGGIIREYLKNGQEHYDIKETPDKRYDSFIATIIRKAKDKLILPSNFKIITWNYDLQLELSLFEYFKRDLENLQTQIQAIPSIPFINSKLEINIGEFALVRLNGVAGLNFLCEKINLLKEELLNRYLKYFGALNDNTHIDLTALNFAWETPTDFQHLYNNYNKVKEYAKEIMKQTDILVVIGYSFPLFNRSVDKELITAAIQNERLRKIYIQDRNANELKTLLQKSFVELDPVFGAGRYHESVIEPITYEDQFILPYDVV